MPAISTSWLFSLSCSSVKHPTTRCGEKAIGKVLGGCTEGVSKVFGRP